MNLKREKNIVDDIQTWRSKSIHSMLVALSVVASFALLSALISLEYAWQLPVYGLSYAALLAVTFIRNVPYKLQTYTILVLIYALAWLGLFAAGLSGDGRVFLITLPLLAVMFLGTWEGLAALILAFLTLVGFATAFSNGWLSTSPQTSADLSSWISGTFVFLMLSTMLFASLRFLVRRFVITLTTSRRLLIDLTEAENTLRERAVGLEKTHNLLSERTKVLEVTAEVAKSASLDLDLPELGAHIVNLVSSSFGFYHVGIYQMDDEHEWAVLQAASSPGGQHMLYQRHRLPINEDDPVGMVLLHGSPHILSDSGDGSVVFNNPDLPATRSQIIVPLRSRDGVIGVLDVQSESVDAFHQEGLNVLQTLADQISIVLSNARLFHEAQERLEELGRVYGDVSREAWRELLRTQVLGKRYDPQGILPPEETWREDMKLAVRRGMTVVGSSTPKTVIAVPIKGHAGEVIGVLDAHKPPDSGGWSAEEIVLMETLSERLGTALDSARLYQDTQRRAAREQAIRAVTDRMQLATDLESLMQITTDELVKVLGGSHAYVRMVAAPADAAASAPSTAAVPGQTQRGDR